jgi:hypothetical protein
MTRLLRQTHTTQTILIAITRLATDGASQESISQCGQSVCLTMAFASHSLLVLKEPGDSYAPRTGHIVIELSIRTVS